MPTTELLDRIARLSPARRAELAERLRGHADSGGEGRDTTGVWLVAYVVPRTGATVTADELRTFLSARLPAAVVPSEFQFLADLPVLPSGKVDRRALPEPGTGRADESVPYQQPRTATERTLAAIWSEALGVTELGVHDGFWAIGGQSLAAARIIARVRTVFQIDLAVGSLFEDQTIARSARRVDRAVRGTAAHAVVPLLAVPRDRDLPLSSAQQRHWFLQQLDPASPAYNICDVFRVDGPLEVAALERAITAIAIRHEVLRTTFPASRGRPVQQIEPDPAPGLLIEDLAEAPAALDEVISRHIRQPFDLSRLPPLRFVLLRVAEERHVLLIVAHHIVADDQAFSILLAELSTLYASFAGGRPSPLPPLAVQYGDYTVWERRVLGTELESGLTYWRSQLAGAPTKPLLSHDYHSASSDPADSGTQTFRITGDTVAALTAWSRQQGSTMFAVLLAAFAELLHRRSGTPDVVIGVPFANRGRPELERLIGCFINPAGLRVDTSGEPGFDELLARCHTAIVGAHAHQHVPFEKVVEALDVERVPGRPVLFTVVLNFTDSIPSLNLPGVVTERLDAGGTATAKYDLTLYVDSAPDVLAGRLVYDAGLFSSQTVADIAVELLALLDEMAIHATATTTDIKGSAT
jgi:hypothetical protein